MNKSFTNALVERKLKNVDIECSTSTKTNFHKCCYLLKSLVKPTPQKFSGARISELTLAENEIDSIDKNLISFCSKFEHLEYLSFESNKILKIEPYVFSNLEKVGFLSLSENLLDHIGKNTFFGLENIRTLVLSKNKLKKLPSNVFQKLNKLHTLNLSRNIISKLNNNLVQTNNNNNPNEKIFF